MTNSMQSIPVGNPYRSPRQISRVALAAAASVVMILAWAFTNGHVNDAGASQFIPNPTLSLINQCNAGVYTYSVGMYNFGGTAPTDFTVTTIIAGGPQQVTVYSIAPGGLKWIDVVMPEGVESTLHVTDPDGKGVDELRVPKPDCIADTETHISLVCDVNADATLLYEWRNTSYATAHFVVKLNGSTLQDSDLVWINGWSTLEVPVSEGDAVTASILVDNTTSSLVDEIVDCVPEQTTTTTVYIPPTTVPPATTSTTVYIPPTTVPATTSTTVPPATTSTTIYIPPTTVPATTSTTIFIPPSTVPPATTSTTVYIPPTTVPPATTSTTVKPTTTTSTTVKPTTTSTTVPVTTSTTVKPTTTTSSSTVPASTSTTVKPTTSTTSSTTSSTTTSTVVASTTSSTVVSSTVVPTSPTTIVPAAVEGITVVRQVQQPAGRLAVTGTSPVMVAGLAVLLLLSGSVLWIASRRLRSGF